MDKIHMSKIVVPVDSRGYKKSIPPPNKQQTSALGRKEKTARYASCHKTINNKLTIHYGLVAGEDKGIGKTAPKQGDKQYVERRN